MDEGQIGVAVFILLSGSSSVLWHHFLPQYMRANIYAALTGAVLFQIFVTIQLGYIDPFSPIAFVTSSVLGLGIAALIGLPYYYKRKDRNVSG